MSHLPPGSQRRDRETQVPIVTKELATRIEQSEVDFWASRLASVQQYDHNPLGIEIRRFDEATAFKVRALPDPMLNRILGLAPESVGLLAGILSWYREDNMHCRFDITPFHHGEELSRCLTERGFYQSGFFTVLYGVPHSASPSPSHRVAVRRFDTLDPDLFVDLKVRMSNVSREDWGYWHSIMKLEFAHPEWRCYVAFVDGSPAGIGALFIRNGIASLASDGTLEEFRGHGCQTALLHARIVHAAAAKCELVVAQASPGSVSQRNIERVGLQTAYTKAVWTEYVGDAQWSAPLRPRPRSRPEIGGFSKSRG